MKKLILGGFAIVLFLVIAYFVYGLIFRVSPPDVAEFSKEGVEMSIDYSRPYKKERLIFGPESDGALQPYGVYWRMGANEATKLTLSQPVSILGNNLEAGSYAMYAFPGKDMWTIGFNGTFDDWGAWEPDYDNDVFRIDVAPVSTDKVIEQMTIRFEESETHLTEIVMTWDEVEIRIPVDKI
jgi:hypothetical protein